ncbi:DUF547 domain-containing protein [Hyphococcus sp.]|jgi:hypothetical protein|uniref:DUF547 domain-containing protein n=1 Tax=Hyphococcus sp. TaxID=2038636 RepID=UPI003D11F8CB
MLIRILPLLLAVCALGSLPARAEEDPFAVFAPYASEPQYTIDHTPWTDFLKRAVYVTGRSDRTPARRSGNQFRINGTRLTTTSTSRYRFEGNRIMFHTFNNDIETYLGLYRQGLQDTMNRVEYDAFSRDEQLAFWLNLYNAVVIHEIAKVHPVAKPSRIRIRDQDARLFDAKLVEVHGVRLSLNDIRHNIVYRYWRSADVLYGFWDGAIGGPSIMPTAFEGDAVRSQLQLNAREFVNSLRGVDRIGGRMRVSQIYVDARPYFFTDWPASLYAHLSRYADWTTAEILAEKPANPRASRFAYNTADVESGETIRSPSSDNPAAVAAGSDLGSRWSNLSSEGMRGGLSYEAAELARKSEARLSRRRGSVYILDVVTDDPDAPETQTLTVEPDEEDGDAQ